MTEYEHNLHFCLLSLCTDIVDMPLSVLEMETLPDIPSTIVFVSKILGQSIETTYTDAVELLELILESD